MKLNKCYACGTGTPELVMTDNGYIFKCTKCKSKTKEKANVFDAQQVWNEGEIYTDENFWKMVLNKAGGENENSDSL